MNDDDFKNELETFLDELIKEHPNLKLLAVFNKRKGILAIRNTECYKTLKSLAIGIICVNVRLDWPNRDSITKLGSFWLANSWVIKDNRFLCIVQTDDVAVAKRIRENTGLRIGTWLKDNS